ncbi:PepSY-associated TM helix domain-containing protein [Bordetella genomosp. 13]|uniref:Peptidase n=1 Tax=Bordetella genomosp. 13 TaxID=463040 RepID=A0A1W6Z9F1_9BORD|nr:PepSY-associated TM helix domain-containing protein [Bordetella genomosp. 13]ARP94003.1 hypothetical protein CAL15_06180 [Bordetella genomosp. 13]
MRWSLRDSMQWAHTWGGVATGLLLMVAFLMGSIAVFDRELDRWMMPDTRLPAPTHAVSLDRVVAPLVQQAAPPGGQVLQWLADLPDARDPSLALAIDGRPFGRVLRLADPHTGTLLPDPGTLGATRFFYPLHYNLHLRAADLGAWLIGFAGMVMLACIVSGVIIHARLFKDFFTFRPGKNLQRSVLDLHNVMGVLALPFHFVITFSGLVIFFLIYLPSAIQALYPEGPNTFYTQWLSRYDRPPAMKPAPLSSLDAMVAEAQRVWGGGQAASVRVRYPGDANAYVEIRRSVQDGIGRGFEPVYFDGPSGAVLQTAPAMPVTSVQRFMVELHSVTFDSDVLRWLYFLGGLAGCVLIATGMLYWVEKRRARHAQQGRLGAALVAGVACAAITGLILATLAMLLANRALPPHMAARQWIEVLVFCGAWLLAALHGIVGALRRRDGSAPWRMQCATIAALALACVVGNALSTGDHLVRTVARGDWAVAGTDFVLLATAAVAAWAARRLALRERAYRSVGEARHA